MTNRACHLDKTPKRRMPLLLAVDIVSLYQTKNVIKESWHSKDRKQIEYGSLQKYNDNK